MKFKLALPWLTKYKVTRYTGRFSVTQIRGPLVQVNRLFGYLIDKVKWIANEGDISDYSSIPNIFDWAVSPFRVNAAGLLHDRAFKTGLDGDGNLTTYWAANRMWRLVAQFGDEDSRANWVQAWVCWFVLTLTGWVVWRKYRRSNSNNAPTKG